MSTQLSNGLLARRRRIIPVTPPVNTGLPVISGTPTLGQVLSASTGEWLGTPPFAFTYRWRRNGSNISGATLSNYTVVAADQGTVVTVVVTATNSAGVDSATSVGTSIVLPDPEYAFGGSAYNANTQSTFSVNLTNLGSDYANRYVILFISGGAGSSSLVSATIGGQAAQEVSVRNVGNIYSRALIAKVPSGSSATAMITFGSNTATLASSWFIASDLQSMVPVSEGTAGGTNTTSVNVSIPAKGICLAYWRVSYGVSPGSTNWSSPMVASMNQDFGTQQRHSLAYRVVSSDIASYNVINSFNYSTTTLNVVVFR